MISKNRISFIRKLHLRKFRDEERLFLVEGWKSVEMLLQSGFETVELFATEDSQQRFEQIVGSRPVTMVSPTEMARLSTMSTAPELLAIARQAQPSPSITSEEPVLVLDRIADPGNLGTMIRTADWFGIRQIVCSPDCVELYNPKTIQATMGSFCHVQVAVRALPELLSEQKKQRRVVGTFLNGTPMPEFSFRSNDMIVIGSESHGISPEVAEHITDSITIPRGGNTSAAESLNAAIAAALVMARMTVLR